MTDEVEDINIRHIKLVTGDDLIGIIIDPSEYDGDGELMLVQKPMELRMAQHDTGMSFVFYDWQPLAKEDICFINPFHVVSHVECANDVKLQYLNACVNDEPTHETESDSDHDVSLPSDRQKYYH